MAMHAPPTWVGHERQGTAYDSGAVGYELVGRATSRGLSAAETRTLIGYHAESIYRHAMLATPTDMQRDLERIKEFIDGLSD